MGKFLSFQETALALISQFGGPVTVERAASALFDPITQTELSNGESEQFMAAVLPPGREAQYKARTLEFSVTAEVYFALKDKAFVPGPGDVLHWNGRSYTIQHSQTYDPAGDGPIMTVAYAI
jgi:hypothetical protein